MPNRNLLLRSLGPAVEQLTPHLAPTSFVTGQVIKQGGEATDAAYFPTRGLISSRFLLESGHEIECALTGATNAIGTVEALGLGTASARYVCITDVHAWKIGLPQLAAFVRRTPGAEEKFLRFCLAELGYAVQVGVCNAMHSTEQRLARWLTTASALLGQQEVRLPQEEIASALGLQRSAVNPALRRLKAKGLVDVARNRIVIIDSDRLGRRACECRKRLRRALFLDGVPPGDAEGPLWEGDAA